MPSGLEKFKFVLACFGTISLVLVLQGCGGPDSIQRDVTTTRTTDLTTTTNMTTTTVPLTTTTNMTTMTVSVTTTTNTTTTTVPVTTTTETTTTTVSVNPEDQELANAVNALYKKDEDGVLMHPMDYMHDEDSPWRACLTRSPSCTWQPLGRLSFVVLNYFAWNDNDMQINTFKNMSNVGFIGTQS